MADGDETRDSVDSLLAEMVKTPGSGTARPLAPGTVLDGQYQIVRALGQGGMGVVYLARDLRLDRDVALKLGHVVSGTALARIEREAVALARLQHPNVVVIHQVGEVDGRLYIAMEHVGGGNARAWVRGRGWREIVGLYAAAGDGLAAAHAAGFVHRDFKPDNVLVGEDGRPRVADFGLVRGVNDSMEPGSGWGTGTGTGNMTRTGAVVGTPAYMAPEQIAGAPVDARADQFAFCASVWEALFDARPYRGKTPAEVAAAIETTEPRAPAAGVPRHVIAALRRGLARARDDRWPSMAPLVAELRRDPRTRRRIALIAAGAAALAAGAALLVARATADDPCHDGAEAIAGSWNAARAGSLARVFDHAGLAASWDAVRGAADRYAAAWAVAHDDACRATRVDGSQSEAALDRRNLCLARARGAFDATIEALGAGQRDALARASDALGALPDLAPCGDTAALGNQTPLPADPTRRARIEAAQLLVSRAQVEAINTWARDPRGLAERELAVAKDAGWPPLVAEATWVHASLITPSARWDAVGHELEDAASLALAAGDDDVAAWALADAAWLLADNGATERAATLLALARAQWHRLGEPAGLGARIEMADSDRLYHLGDGPGTIDATRRAVALRARAHPDDDVGAANDHYNLAVAYWHAQQIDAAAHEIDLALRTGEAAVGPRHPMIGGFLPLASQIDQARGRIDDAVARARRGLDIMESWYGADDPRVEPALEVLGELFAVNGDPAQARPLLERSIAMQRARDPDLPRTSGALGVLAVADARAGHCDQALAVAGPLVDALDAHPADPQGDVDLLLLVGRCQREVGSLEPSRASLERAAALAERAFGADAPSSVNLAIERSYTLVALHRARDAVALLAPRLAAARATDVTPPVAAELRTALADALWQAGGDRARARALAEDGLARYTALGDPYADEQRRARAWLAGHEAR